MTVDASAGCRSPRVAVFSLSPTPHFVPLLRAWTDGGVDVRALFLQRTSPHRRWATPDLDFAANAFITSARKLSGFRAVLEGFRSARRHGRGCEIWVLSGSYAHPAFVGVWLAVRLSGRPFVFWGERPRRRRGRVWRYGRDAWIRALLRSAAEVWTPSKSAIEYYEQLGVSPALLVPYPLDWSKSAAGTIAEKWARSELLDLVVVGSLIPRKRPEMALRVIRAARDAGMDLRVRFVGDGPLLGGLIAGASDLPVEFCGHQDPGAVRDALESAHVLLHTANEDGWGMVVAEAVSCGAAVVGSAWTDAVVELSEHLPTVVKCGDAIADYVAGLEQVVAKCRADHGLADATARHLGDICGPEVLGRRSLDALERLTAHA